MAEIIQVRYEELDKLIPQIQNQAQQINALIKKMQSQTTKLAGSWKGRGGEQFQNEMEEVILPSANRLTDSFEALGDTLRVFKEAFLKAEEEAVKCLSDTEQTRQSNFLEWAHGILDVAGFVPGFGEVADAVNALVYLGEGRYLEAGISAAAMIPVLGDAGKIGKWGVKASKEMVEMASERGAKELADSMIDAIKHGSDVVPSSRLTRGLLGERLATEALAADGHKIISWKPDLTGTNRPGFDIVTVKDGYLHAVDNKALTRAGNVNLVSSLTRNIDKNLTSTRSEIASVLQTSTHPEQRRVLTEALQAIDAGRVRRVVTNANMTPDDKILSGVSRGLERQGIEFIDVFK